VSRATGAPAGGAARGAANGAASPGTYRAVLPNGLVLLLRENHANPTIALQGLVKAGALFDLEAAPDGAKAGLARFTASMLDQGAGARDALAMASAVEDLGASLHFESAGETVSIRGTMLAEDLDALFDVASDALRRPNFPEEQVEKIRAELLNDARLAESTTTSVATRRSSEMLFPASHPFHHHRGGTEATIRAIARADLQAFHARRYRPDATAIALVGDVTPERALEAATRAFGDWAPPTEPFRLEIPSAPAPAWALRRVVAMPGRSQADLVFALPGVSRTAPDYDAAMMMNYVLGGASLSSRLMENLRDAQGLVYGVYSMLTPGLGAGPLQIRAGTNPANVERCVGSVLAELCRLRDEGPSPEEIDAAKGYLTGVFPVRLEANSGVAAQILAVELYELGVDYIERYDSIIEGVAREAVADAARRYLSDERYVLVVAGDLPEEAVHAVPTI
jgi:zinc protease